MLVDQTDITLSTRSTTPSVSSSRISLYHDKANKRLFQVDDKNITTDIGWPTNVNYAHYQWDCDSIATTLTAPGWHSTLLGAGTVTQVNQGIDTGTLARNQTFDLANHPGVITISSNGTANQGGTVFWGGNAGRFLLQPGMLFDAVILLPEIRDCSLRIGFHNSSNTTFPTNGIFFDIDGTNTLTCRVINNSTQTSGAFAGLLSLSANTWYHLKIIVVSATHVIFQIFSDDGTLLSYNNKSIYTTFPTGSGRECLPRINATTNGGLTRNLMQVDFMRWSMPVTRGALN